MGKRNIHLAKLIILMMWKRLNNALHFCNAEMKNRTELNLGKIVNISNVYYISDSWLNLLNGDDFYFWLRDSVNQQF